MRTQLPHAVFLVVVLSLSALLASASAASAAGPTRVPAWNARGLGPLPAQGIASADMTDDGSLVAVGTGAPPGVPNVLVLHAAGQRCISEVALADGGTFLSAVCVVPKGNVSSCPAVCTFSTRGELMTEIPDGFRRFSMAGIKKMIEHGSHAQTDCEE